MTGSRVEYLTPPEKVRMDDRYFDLADLDHFWVRRRFEVFRRLVPDLAGSALDLAEVGCGHGVVQRQVEDQLDLAVDGFDLSQYALERNISRRGRVVCLDVHQQPAELAGRYDAVFLFDVLEHIEDERSFLDATLHLLRDGGRVFVNVPAFMAFFSAYDTAQGHVRRYDHRMLEATAGRSGLEIARWTYWGLPMTPLLWLRRLRLAGASDEEAYRKGFQPPGRLANRILRVLSRCERVPQRLFGTSLMAVLAGG